MYARAISTYWYEKSMTATKNDNTPLSSSIIAIKDATAKASDYLSELAERDVAPSPLALENLRYFEEELPAYSSDPLEVLELLHTYGSPATVATAGGRFYGLVVGGSVPAAAGARVLNAAWDQMATTDATSPVSVALENVASKWVVELLGLPAQSSVGYVSGTTMGNFVCLSAARHALLARQGWNVETQGLYDAPKLHVVASQEMHITVKKVLSMLGLGSANVEYVACDSDGAMRIDALPVLTEMSIVLTQAGNVNSGACDPIGEIAKRAAGSGAWVHVDGAFGLWAAASRSRASLLPDLELADSWVTDGHKWLNTPYDCGMAICKHPAQVHKAMSTVAPYLKVGSAAAPKDMVPELSRTVRGVEMWATVRSLGKQGVEDLVDRCCNHASMMADALRGMGFEVLNKVVLNQVVATLDSKQHLMIKLAERVVASGEAWFGPTHWRGKDAFRISFSSWVTSDDDVLRAIEAIKLAAEELELFP
ncbi:MAG: glutamate/tyrosine decarboxylase-like PLP-dependent enzyme [Cryomorphaceae bacterium]|jgi:glutamate/tyrosine decarboxylase-like PLP-dependent enzyme